MNAKMILNSKAGMVGVVVVGALAVLAVASYKAEKAVIATGEAINPLNDNNVFASSVDAVGAKLSGKSNFKLGAWIYDITHN